jgi:hypothetical protein
MSGSVPETQDEVFVPLVRIILHQVPQNWPAANRVTIGLEIVSETSRPRVPNPPQNSTTFHGELDWAAEVVQRGCPGWNSAQRKSADG